jgi:hypothetical protein
MSQQTVSSGQLEAPEAVLKEVQLKQVRSLLSIYRQILEDSERGKNAYSAENVCFSFVCSSSSHIFQRARAHTHTRTHAHTHTHTHTHTCPCNTTVMLVLFQPRFRYHHPMVTVHENQFQDFYIQTHMHITFQKRFLLYYGRGAGWKRVNPSKCRSRFLTVLFTK